MPLTFRALPPTFKEFQDRRTELERREVERGVFLYLLRTAALVLASMGFLMSSLALARRHHPAFHPPARSLVSVVIGLFLLSLWAALSVFRRKQKRVQLGTSGLVR